MKLKTGKNIKINKNDNFNNNKIDKPLAILTNNERGNTQKNRNKVGHIRNNAMEFKRNLREYYEQFYAKKIG